MNPTIDKLVSDLATAASVEYPMDPTTISDRANVLAEAIAHLIDLAVGEDMGNEVQNSWAWVVASRVLPKLHELRHAT